MDVAELIVKFMYQMDDAFQALINNLVPNLDVFLMMLSLKLLAILLI